MKVLSIGSVAPQMSKATGDVVEVESTEDIYVGKTGTKYLLWDSVIINIGGGDIAIGDKFAISYTKLNDRYTGKRV